MTKRTTISPAALAAIRKKVAEADSSARRTTRSAQVQVAEPPKADGAYSMRGQHSYFRDLLAVTGADRRRHDAILGSRSRGGDLDRFHPDVPAPGQGTVHDARARLATLEKRDLTTGSAPGGGALLPGSSPPGFVASAFAASAQAAGVLPRVIPVEPLPTAGMKVEVARIDTAASAAVQATQNTAASETDLDTSTASSNVTTIAGIQDLSRQLFDRGHQGGALDVILAAELGRLVAVQLDTQALAGSNASGQTLGLRNVSNVLTTTWTAATPTVSAFISKLWSAYNALAAYGPADPTAYLLLLHPRRLAWVYANVTGADPLSLLPGRAVCCAQIGTTYGATTSQDEVYLLNPAESTLYINPVRFTIHEEVLSGTLSIRVAAVQMFAAMFDRRPESINIISGTGMVAPTL